MVHVHEVQEIKTSVAVGATMKTTVVQTGDRNDLVPRFRLRWKHASPLSNFWFTLKEMRRVIILRQRLIHRTYHGMRFRADCNSSDERFADLGIGNIDVTRQSNDDACQCTGTFRGRSLFATLRASAPH